MLEILASRDEGRASPTVLRELLVVKEHGGVGGGASGDLMLLCGRFLCVVMCSGTVWWKLMKLDLETIMSKYRIDVGMCAHGEPVDGANDALVDLGAALEIRVVHARWGKEVYW